MAEKYIFHMYGVNKFYGQKQVLRDINLSFYPGAKIGIVGENGAGKTTVLNIMAGRDTEFIGHAFITPGYRAGMVEQEPQLDPQLTVRQTIESAFGETKALLDEYNRLADSMAAPADDAAMQKAMDRMGVLQDKIEAVDAWNLDQRLKVAADALCLPEDDRIVGTLSGGERRRVALCKVLLEKPDLLLLDEPTNHLDAETINWLEEQLREYPGTVIIVTHDRYFLDNVTRWILELDGGHGIPWEGNYSSWLEQKLAALAESEKKNSPRARALERELSWIRMSRGDRTELTRARMREYEQLVARETAAAKGAEAVIRIAPGPELGSQVIEFREVGMGYDSRRLFENLSFAVPRSAVVGLVGPNGAGKTTLLKMVTGDVAPSEGQVVIGSTVRLAYVDQEREALAGGRSLIEEIGGGAEEIMIGKRAVPIRQYLAQFGFKGAAQQKMASELSGGERNRCLLAKVLKSGGNVLLLDEPTNDLDVNTLRMLEEAILDFSGCVLVISHDRFFLDRIGTHLLVFEGEGKVRWFEGTFSEYEEWRIREMGDRLFENRRNRYRTIVRA
ncbi:MAG TPA: energy-dependent translational throttle protein EttA [candidate division Zixibacteria bacterium]|nr:energy-dependent translational throttle protein EttA [candidate division Zixibacteria bacterium]MDD4917409.1 energy-dependent translational throttle protein EttA [candidate division Zixibacteria bacterium]MDM7972967.1 energy-dependent translational throttle protein EttA [candidate division Zixibacteria bacterium]HOD66923.1 energy-dependent translational throttle protein EttA [candidate division Zixibacteria bacterium]HOZ07046.1 energy-dependent translational throttle protein EttA [candidate 